MCLCGITSPQNSATGTVTIDGPNPEIGVLWTEIEPNLRGVLFFLFTLPSVICVHAKRSHGPLRDTLWWLMQSRLPFSTLETPRNEAEQSLVLVLLVNIGDEKYASLSVIAHNAFSFHLFVFFFCCVEAN